MKKAQQRTKKAVSFILNATNLTQREFAEMIGASLDTVKSWTRKKNPSPISRQFEERILAATGAKIMPDGAVVIFREYGNYQTGELFTLETFNFWRAHQTQPTEIMADYNACQAADMVRRILHAAIKPVRGKRNGTLAVMNSFWDWAADTTKTFNLQRRLEAMGSDYFPIELGFISPPLTNPYMTHNDAPAANVARKNRVEMVNTSKTTLPIKKPAPMKARA